MLIKNVDRLWLIIIMINVTGSQSTPEIKIPKLEE